MQQKRDFTYFKASLLPQLVAFSKSFAKLFRLNYAKRLKIPCGKYEMGNARAEKKEKPNPCLENKREKRE